MNSSTVLHPQAVELLFVGDVFRDILQALDCRLEDIAEYVPDKSN